MGCVQTLPHYSGKKITESWSDLLLITKIRIACKTEATVVIKPKELLAVTKLVIKFE